MRLLRASAFWGAAWLAISCSQPMARENANPAIAISDQMLVQGPWFYTNEPSDGRTARAAITRSRESDGVWFGFSCAKDPRAFASILDQNGVAGAAGGETPVTVTFDAEAPVKAFAKKAEDNRLIFDPETSQMLLLGVIHKKSLRLTFSEATAKDSSFTFGLQPNDEALRGILVYCFKQGPDQDL